MDRIDAHVHLWDSERFTYPWFQSGAFAALPARYLPEDLTRDSHQTIAQAVVVQAEMDHAADPLLETAWVQQLSEEPGSGAVIGGFVAYADLASEGVEAVLERHRAHPISRGIRQELWWQTPSPRADILSRDLIADPAWQRSFSLLQPLDLSFDLTCWHWQLEPFARVLQHCPETTLIVDHLGSPTPEQGEAFTVWRRGLRALASCPNTFIKLSGFSQVLNPWGATDIAPFVNEVLEAFGPSRCMFGSNMPLEGLSTSYGDVLRAVAELTSQLSETEQQDVFSGTARRAYRLEPQRE
ncbi:hypothetical protein EVJ50_10960 [Synechococcus sp. RSCCF101]|uniref:amidohydrolase family protein n=1 Tax=Synechococcus sp. RSCCF101 TaxID=2511069 RepID=UPI001247E499|nr:amidohydrolase family protein [Synechococcus sp. RSCCF101]QEY32664.1 hypothetical protein EVJ50_10960 [Synechococcus sp. RSCCF101]